ncbi:MAG: hypothetical protein J1E95_09495 [Muribaculaceae bacterium]|nr:hypothetical protein [Muribaculaceae bacterium]
MKKSETIAVYREDFLSGKSEEYRNKFENKTESQQYQAIMNWKSNALKLGQATNDLAKVTMKNVIAHLKDAHKKLKNLPALSTAEQLKIQKLLDSVKDTIDNFDRVKKEQLLVKLQGEQEKLQRDKENLSSQIEKLRNELGK